MQFEKYPSEVSNSQCFVIGYVKDGILYDGTAFTQSEGQFSLDIKEDGEYYIYFIRSFSDLISLKKELFK